MSQSIDKNEALKRIDEVLKYVNETLTVINQEIANHPNDSNVKANLVSQANVSLILKLKQTIEDVAPRNSEYRLFANSIKRPFSSNMIYELGGILQSLRHDYANDFLKNFDELVDAELFAAILEQAEYLLSQEYFRASAIAAGVALESHLRKLAEKNSIPITTDEGKYLKAETLNENLLKNEIIDKTMKKHVTGWLGLRNDAAHPDTKEIKEGLIEPMIAGIRVFIEKYPA